MIPRCPQAGFVAKFSREKIRLVRQIGYSCDKLFPCVKAAVPKKCFQGESLLAPDARSNLIGLSINQTFPQNRVDTGNDPMLQNHTD